MDKLSYLCDIQRIFLNPADFRVASQTFLKPSPFFQYYGLIALQELTISLLSHRIDAFGIDRPLNTRSFSSGYCDVVPRRAALFAIEI